MKKTAIALIIISISALIIFKDKIYKMFFSPTDSQIPTGTIEKTPEVSSLPGQNINILATNLNIPWDIAFLPDGDLLVTERDGSLLKLGASTQVISEISGVAHIGEGGLLGVALDPQFIQNGQIYLYLTSRENGRLTNRIEKYNLAGTSLSGRQVILSGISGAPSHDGGRMEFGPDGKLYITTGDAEEPNVAQNTNSLNGKILRINSDGTTPPDNPFGNAVYSYGHRNPQGLSWDSQGRLWSTEHGPSGAQTGNDEVNLIVKGGNYGWPQIKGSQSQSGMVSPVIESGRSETWAPGDAEIISNNLYFVGLRGEALYTAKIVGDKLTDMKRHFQSEYGRLRAIRKGPDGFLYISTSNRDGRGNINEGDDKIIRINPEILN